MIEPKLNETLTIDGKAVKCIQSRLRTCEGCINEHKRINNYCKDINCSWEERDDKLDIILISI